jgi:predicted nucleotide-binding protein
LAVEEYSTTSTTGFSRKERLLQLKASAGFAFLVATAEDPAGDQMRARQNVVHEIGFFQGHLGFERAIVLLEDGCDFFSNMDGIDHIPFRKGDIKSAFYRVQEVLEREGFLAP